MNTATSAAKATISRLTSILVIVIVTTAVALAITLPGQPVPADAQTTSDNATLSSVTVDAVEVPGFDSDVSSAHYGVAHNVESVTVAGTPEDTNATVSYSGTDADTSTVGFQKTLRAGNNQVTITVTAADGTTQESWTIHINRGVSTLHGWKASEDFDVLKIAGSNSPRQIWTNGTTMWVLDTFDPKIYAYNLSTKARDTSKDFDTLDAAGNDDPTGIWANSTTMWVLDQRDDKIYAYSMATKARDNSKDFDTLGDAGNEAAYGLWSNGTTMWVADSFDRKIYAYNMSDKTRDDTKDLTTLDSNTNWTPNAIWSDGATMWVVDFLQIKIYAYKMSDQTLDTDKNFTTLSSAGNQMPFGITSDGITMWVTDKADVKIYSYVHHVLSTDSTLSAISVDGTAISGFDSAMTSHRHVVTGTTTQATVSATATDDAASVEITSPTDADSAADGHQVAVSEGANAVAITVTAEDGTTQDYTLNVVRPSTAYFDWKQTDDFNTLDASNTLPTGIWSDGATMWVSNSLDTTIYAYSMATMMRDSAKDFTNLDDDNDDPTAIWSDGTTMWIADDGQDKLFAYTLSTKARDAAKDFDTLSAAGNVHPFGIWSDGATMWVSDNSNDKIYAYRMSDQAREPAQDFDTLADARNTKPWGIWSDGRTMWVVDANADELSAYNMDTKARDPDKDFNTLDAAGNNSPWGIWADGITLWVTDYGDDKLYSYNFSRENALDLSYIGHEEYDPDDVDEIGFDPDTTTYEINPFPNFIVTPEDPDAHVTYNIPDIYPESPGHQIPANEGRTTLSITVTADGNPTHKTYNLHFSVEDLPNSPDTRGWALIDKGDGPPVLTRGSVKAANDIDWYSVVLQPNQLYGIILKGAKFGNSDRTLTMPHLAGLFTGTFIHGDRDPVTGSRPRIYTITFQEGTDSLGIRHVSGLAGWARGLFKHSNADNTFYYIAVGGAFPENVGTYDLQVRELEDDHYPNGTDTTSTITPGTPEAGNIQYKFDSDWFRASGLISGGKYVVEARGGKIYHTVSVYDEDGKRIDLGSHGSPFTFKPESDQEYYFKVYGHAPETRGAYRLYVHDLLTLSGTAMVGETLSVASTEIHDPDGVTRATANDSWRYRWFRVDANGDQSRIRRATNSSYTITDDDANHRIKAKICYRDDGTRNGRTEECRFSQISSIVPGTSSQQGNQTATGLPTITGSTNVGDTVTADVTGIADEDGLTNVAYSYQWLSGDNEITGETSSTYTLARSDFGQAVKVRVSFTDDAGNDETLTSEGVYPSMTATEEPATTNTPATGQPAITGTPQVGQTLTASTGNIADEDGLDDVSYSYQWLANDAAISDATGQSHTLTRDQEGDTIKVQVSFTDDAGNEETLTSSTTAAVSPKVPDAPTNLTGDMNSDGSITITWNAPENDTVTGYEILRRQPQENEPQMLTHVANTGNANTTYTDTDTDLPNYTLYEYRVKAINSSGTGPQSNYVNVERTLPLPPAPTNLNASINDDGHVVLSWTAPDDDSITGYHIMRRMPRQNEDTLLIHEPDTGSTATTYTDDDVTAGELYVYRVKAINEAGVGPHSNFVNAEP